MALKRAQQAGRVAYINTRLVNIFGYHGRRPDNHAVANRDGQNRRICPNADAVTNLRRPPKIAPSLCRPSLRKKIINEHRAVRNETVIPDQYELTDKRMRLNAASLSDDDAPLDFDKGPDEAILANGAAVKVYGLNDGDPF